MTKPSDQHLTLGHPWFETMKELELGRFPSKPGLVFGLSSDAPVPQAVRKFLADLVDGKVKAPRGRPERSWLDREVTGNYVRATYAFAKELVDDENAQGVHLGDKPSEIALIRAQEMLAQDGENMSVESIRDIVYRRNGWGD